MLNEEKGKLYFIDFEYGSYNYRGFDIGNHFNEYVGYDCDYTLYPSKDEQFHFFRHYLDSDQLNEVSDKDLEALYVETSSYMLASHLYWALIQAKMSPIDFDYISYFFAPYNEYKKQNCFSLAKSSLSTLSWVKDPFNTVVETHKSCQLTRTFRFHLLQSRNGCCSQVEQCKVILFRFSFSAKRI